MDEEKSWNDEELKIKDITPQQEPQAIPVRQDKPTPQEIPKKLVQEVKKVTNPVPGKMEFLK